MLPDHCLQGRYGLLLGDSSAGALVGSFAKHFAAHQVRLITLTRGGCNIVLFTPLERRQHPRHGCTNLVAPFERILSAATPPEFVVLNSAWADRGLITAAHLSELFSQFDPAQTRILMIGPVPTFYTMSLDCIVLSDRYGRSRDACVRPRAEVEADRGAVVTALKAAAEKFPNVRYIDPVDLICDDAICRPFSGDKVLYLDQGHVTPQGADTIFDQFAEDFLWLMAKR
jgi:hypothetical protein